MKKILSCLIAGAMMTAVLSGCGGKKKLIMATEAGFAPYEYRVGEEIRGVDPDIAQEIAKELGRELQIVDMEFDAIVPSVDSGKADFGAAGMSITPDKQEVVDFSVPYAVTRQVILVKQGSDIQGRDDLAGRKVGVQLGTTADSYFQDEYKEVEVKQYDKYFEATNDLANGRIDAIVADELPAQEIQKTAEDLVILEEVLFSDSYAICVKKGNQELLDAINKVVQRLIDEGKIQEFTQTHLSSQEQ